MNQERSENQEDPNDDSTNWNSWYILLVAVLVAQIAFFWIITDKYAG